MAEYRKDKYYWFKMKEGFFKRHDIRIIKAMPNGKDYIIFYLQLLCESLSHDGHLRFSDTIPYDENMLSVITETNIDIVRSAMKLFAELDMIEILDDRTIYMKTLRNMVGSTTIGAEKKQLQRLNQNKVELLEGGQRVDKCPPEIEKELDIDKDIEIEIEIERECETDSPNPAPHPQPIKSVKRKYGEYKNVRLTDEEVGKLKKEYGIDMTDKAIAHLDEYIEYKGYKAKSHYLAIRKWVIDAVNEKVFKRQKATSKSDAAQYHKYDDFINRVIFREEKEEPVTVGNNEELKARADALKERISG